MVGVVPDRVQRAVALLDLRGDEVVLEIGPGPGAAAELVLARHPGVRYVAVDRSATAVARTTARNRAAVDRGRLIVRQGTSRTLTSPTPSVARSTSSSR